MEYLMTFLVGGAFCLAAQILIDKTKLTPANILVSYVCVGAFLSTVGVYGYIVDFAGYGATVPLTGFGHMLAQGVKKAVDENGLIGCLTGGFTASAAGVCASVVFAVLWSLLFKSKEKQ